MKANELRLGNHVFNRSRELIKVTVHEIDLMVTWEREKYSTHTPISGIPLTEEWLIKIALNEPFEISGDVVSIYPHFADDNIWFFSFEGNVSIEIKYLHQLQNLYFALTGEELRV